MSAQQCLTQLCQHLALGQRTYTPQYTLTILAHLTSAAGTKTGITQN